MVTTQFAREHNISITTAALLNNRGHRETDPKRTLTIHKNRVHDIYLDIGINIMIARMQFTGTISQLN